MLVFLPILSFLLMLASLRLRLRSQCWREAFLGAAVSLGALMVLATETLSLFRLLTLPAVACFWAITSLGAAWFLHASRKRPSTPETTDNEKPSVVSRLLLAGVGLYVLTTALIALVAPPNTWDSMEYHMPKVMHWLQNQSVAFYPTAIPRQNHLGPGAEFAVLHLQILSGSDRFANFVEWFGMVGSLVAVSLIARELGARARGQILAAVFAVTLPMGIMQASSTQTDYVIAFWFVCFVYYLLRLQRKDTDWPHLLAMSAAIGLAVLTKATAYLLGPAFLLWFAVAQIRVRGARALGAFGVLAAVFLALNSGPYARNWALHRNPLGPGHEPTPNSKYSLDTHEPKALISNLSRHIGTHINTPWKGCNRGVRQAYVDFHQWLGFDLNDPRTTFAVPFVRFSIQRTGFQDESDGNPVHLLVGIGCGVLMLSYRTLRKDRVLLKYAGALLTGALLFAFYLKWHPWMSRLHTGLFVLTAPLAGAVLARFWTGRLAAVVGGLLLLLGVPWLLYCQERPMVGPKNVFITPRDRLYFNTPHQSYVDAFLHGREFLRSRQVTGVGLVAANTSWEYPWWVWLRQDHPGVRLEHVNATDVSSRFYAEEPFRTFQPDAVIALDQSPSPTTVTVAGTVYTQQWEEGKVAIYLKEP